MVKVIVSDTTLTAREGVGKKSGKEYKFFLQKAYVDTGDERRRIELVVDADQEAYAPGTYEIDFAKSLFWDRFGKPQLGSIRLGNKTGTAASDLRRAS